MAMHGIIGEFKPSQEDWQSYVERLDQYFTANDVAAPGKRRAILLSSVGPVTYRLIRNLLAPDKPTDKTLKEIVDIVRDHHQPKPSVTMQRFTFHSRTRQTGESISTYISELRKLSEHCDFGATLNDMLRDRLVCGVNDQRIQRRLLAEKDLTFDTAKQLALAVEVADKNSRELESAKSNGVHKLSSHSKGGGAQQQCYRCRGRHAADKCRFIDSECHHCGKKGHISKACRTKQREETQPKRLPRHSQQRRGKRHSTHQVREDESESNDELESTNNILALKEQRPSPFIVKVQLNNCNLNMEIDTGASASLLSMDTYRRLWKKGTRPELKPSSRRLKTYTGELLNVEGTIDVEVTYEKQRKVLPLLVVRGDGPNLIGRDWLIQIRLDWNALGINNLKPAPPTSLQEVLQNNETVFRDELGFVDGVTATLHIDAGVEPRFCKARKVPFALRPKVDDELERLERVGVIRPVQFSEWAAPIVPVLKRDGTVRICGDYKVTVNKAAKPDSYPLPRIDDMFTALTGGKQFTKLDLAHAYQQIGLDDASKKLVTINTQKGLFEYTRLPFGVSAAPAIFQRTMEGILRGIPQVCVYLDDILVTGKTKEEHLQRLNTVLQRLQDAGMRLKKKKCEFMMNSVEYLGHSISAEGLRPTTEKVRAIKNAPPPENVTQLRAFLGLINYYGKFLPNLSSLLAPLYQLLEKQKQWIWGPNQKKAFENAKQHLTSNCLLTHFDPEQEVVLSCDASPYGVGAVLSHTFSEDTEKPICFASRSLTAAERKYSQLDKEALSIMFGIKKFHDYLFGRKFMIRSDHKPLQHLFNADKPIPTQASARIQRWALILSGYNYTIAYKPGEQHGNADSLSRLPLPECPANQVLPPELVMLMDTLQYGPITPREIRRWTETDPLLSKVKHYILQGWKNETDEELKPFYRRRYELSLHDECILWGCRVIVPKKGRARVLDQLHQGHPGMARMKGLARSIVWWPGIDTDITSKVESCQQCQQNQKTPPTAPLQPWRWPDQPWSRIHIDHAGPFLGKLFLIVVDAHSKWIEVVVVPSTNTQITIQKLRTIFAVHGLPETLVSDNASCFTSAEFKQFLDKNGIRHITSAPYHPATNGLAERAVQTFKDGMKKCSEGDIETKLARFLFHYRNTPHTTTGISPAKLLFNREPRSHLTILRPSLSSKIRHKQTQQKGSHDLGTKNRSFNIDDPVFVRNFASTGHRWLPGIIIEKKGPVTCHIALSDGRVFRRHVDHIRKRTCVTSDTDTPDDDFIPVPTLPSQDNDPPTQNSESMSTEQFRRSTRVRNPPDRLMKIES